MSSVDPESDCPADYDNYCPKCKHFLEPEVSYPCDICMDELSVPGDTCGEPINFEEK